MFGAEATKHKVQKGATEQLGMCPPEHLHN